MKIIEKNLARTKSPHYIYTNKQKQMKNLTTTAVLGIFALLVFQQYSAIEIIGNLEYSSGAAPEDDFMGVVVMAFTATLTLVYLIPKIAKEFKEDSNQ